MVLRGRGSWGLLPAACRSWAKTGVWVLPLSHDCELTHTHLEHLLTPFLCVTVALYPPNTHAHTTSNTRRLQASPLTLYAAPRVSVLHASFMEHLLALAHERYAILAQWPDFSTMFGKDYYYRCVCGVGACLIDCLLPRRLPVTGALTISSLLSAVAH